MMLRLAVPVILGAMLIPTLARPVFAQGNGQVQPPPPPPPPPQLSSVTVAVPAPRPQPKKLPLFYIDLKDAPTRKALELIFGAAKADYSIENGVKGYLTLRSGGGTVEDFLSLAARRHPDGLKWTRQSDVYLIKPTGEQKQALPLPAPISPTAFKEVGQVPRRIAGIARGSQWYAILVTGEGETAEQNAQIIRIGDPVPSGVSGVPDLKVEKISAREVVFALPDGVTVDGQPTITVPIRRLKAEKE